MRKLIIQSSISYILLELKFFDEIVTQWFKQVI